MFEVKVTRYTHPTGERLRATLTDGPFRLTATVAVQPGLSDNDNKRRAVAIVLRKASKTAEFEGELLRVDADRWLYTPVLALHVEDIFPLTLTLPDTL